MDVLIKVIIVAVGVAVWLLFIIGMEKRNVKVDRLRAGEASKEASASE